MLHSTLTKKGQTTIPGEVRKALRIRPGDRLAYTVQGDHAILRVHPGLHALAGALRSERGVGPSWEQIRAEAAAQAQRRRERR